MEPALPDRRRHRGPHPADEVLFAASCHAPLRRATDDLAWLLGRGYRYPSALKLVGDRHRLRERQRLAVLRSTCSDDQRQHRALRERDTAALRGAPLRVDGYNVLITLEAALAGGVLLLGRDGCLRDLASVHGHFKRVDETEPAIALLGEALAAWGVADCTVYLDQPVSNSGRLAGILRAAAAARGWPWTVQLVRSPDARLKATEDLVATADGAVLDACGAWVNLARRVVATRIPDAAWVDLSRA